jgi:hypothetical protein
VYTSGNRAPTFNAHATSVIIGVFNQKFEIRKIKNVAVKRFQGIDLGDFG